MIALPVAACPLCGQSNSRLFDQRAFKELSITNRLCGSCGLVYQSPRMSDEELAAFYQQEYRQLYQGSQGPSPKDLAVQGLRAQSLLDFVRPHVPAVARHLDVGCSAGLLLQGFAGKYSSQPTGIEPGDAYRNYAVEQGLTVYRSLEELAAADGAGTRFDLISLAHVIEHLPDPVQALTDLRERWLAPGGWLLIETPNLYGHDCFEVAHLVSYSPHTLRQALQQASFEVAFESIHGRPRSLILPLYITVLAQAGGPSAVEGNRPAITPERGVRRKRQIAMLRRQVAERLQPGQAWLPAGGK